VQGRLDPEGVAEDGRRRREGVGSLGAPGMRRRVGAGELLRGSFSFLDDQIPLSFFLPLLSATFLLALRQLQLSVHLASKFWVPSLNAATHGFFLATSL
jgi:hypothetical protein